MEPPERDANTPRLLNTLLRALRERGAPNKTASSIATEMGLAKSYLSKIENGEQEKPSDEAIRKIDEYFTDGNVNDLRHLVRYLHPLVRDHGPLFDVGTLPRQYVRFVEMIEHNICSSCAIFHGCYSNNRLLEKSGKAPHILTHAAIVATLVEQEAWLSNEERRMEFFDRDSATESIYLLPPMKIPELLQVTSVLIGDGLLVFNPGRRASFSALGGLVEDWKRGLQRLIESAVPKTERSNYVHFVSQHLKQLSHP